MFLYVQLFISLVRVFVYEDICRIKAGQKRAVFAASTAFKTCVCNKQYRYMYVYTYVSTQCDVGTVCSFRQQVECVAL